MKRNVIKKALAIYLGLCTAMSCGFLVPVYAEDIFRSFEDTFENDEIGVLPENYISNFSDGEIEVNEYLGQKCLSVSKDADGRLSTVKRKFTAVSDVGIDIKFDFLQKNVKTDGTTLFALCNSGTEIVALETKNGGICYKNSAGGYDTLISSYQANKWYSFRVNVNLGEGKVSVYESDKKLLSGAKQTNESASCDAVCFYTKYSPGFCIDNLSVVNTNKPDVIRIEGDGKITLPKSGKNNYEYNAVMYDDYGTEMIDTEFNWEVIPSGIDGIDITKENEKITLSVSKNANYTGILKLTAFCKNDPSYRKTKDIMLTEAIISSIEITGESKLAYGLNDNKFKYEYKMYDQYGILQNNEEVIWKIKEKTGDASVDTDGIVTVNKPIDNQKHITLTASYAEDRNVVAEKKLTLIDYDMYMDDQARMDILCDAIDNYFEYGKDIYNGSPLLACNIDLHTGMPMTVKAWTNFEKPNEEPVGDVTVPTDLTIDSCLYRAIDAAAVLTGREEYSKRVDEIYQWYLDNGINEYGLGYWGGHTYIDLKTLQPVQCEGNKHNHELKDTGFYLAPFFRLDPDRAYTLAKTMWGAHMGSAANWSQLICNRHAMWDSSAGPSIASSTAMWDDLSVYDENATWLRDKTNEPFRAIGDDLATIAATTYKYTGDEKAKTWAYRILQCYYKCRDKNTGMIPSIYITGRNAQGGLDPDKEFPGWRTMTANNSTWTHSTYGDRFFNQFAQDLVNQGFYDESVLAKNDTRLLEGNYFGNDDNFCTPVILDLQIAKALGDDTPEAKEIKRLQTTSIASYIKYAWIKGTAKIRPIMADGTSLMGFKPTSNGYYSNYYDTPSTFGSRAISVNLFPSVCACYDIAKKDKTLSEQADILWGYLQFFSKYYGLGTFGKNDIGDTGMELNYATTCSDPSLLMAVVDVYYATEIDEFLTLARRIAENMISTYYKYGIFVQKSSTGIGPNQYFQIRLGDINAIKYYSLCYLEAAIRGERELIPEYYPYDSYLHGYAEFYHNGRMERQELNHLTSDTAKYNPVEAQELIIDDVIYLAPGEIKKLEYKVLPDDVTSTSIVCESTDKEIVRINKDNLNLQGIKKGTAELIVCSNDFNIIKTVKVVVSEEVQDEEDN